MKGLLVAATKAEVARSLQYLNTQTHWQTVVTGVGGVATTYALYKAIHKYKPGIMLQAGIAGSFDKKLEPGSVVCVGSDCFGDLGVVEQGKKKTLFDLQLAGADSKPFKNGKLFNPFKKIIKLAGLPIVNGVSVNEISTIKSNINFYKKELAAGVESMEGAAFHYVALMEKIPFLQIRSISNMVGERNKEKWLMQQAIENLNTEVINFVSKVKI